jgi:hypothetical protein
MNTAAKINSGLAINPNHKILIHSNIVIIFPPLYMIGHLLHRNNMSSKYIILTNISRLVLPRRPILCLYTQRRNLPSYISFLCGYLLLPSALD